MKISVNWLKEHVELPDDLDSLAECLTLAGVEVVGFEPFRPFEKIVAAKVLDVSKHPDADKLSVVTVSLGDTTKKIVCAAPNVAAGMVAPLALPGAVLPNGLAIVARAVWGVMSEGMLCAEDELGLGTDHSGILTLPENIPLGRPLEVLNGADDLVMELELTPNRPDLYCVLGLAREIAGLYNVPFKNPFDDVKKLKAASGVTVINSVPEEICPSYNLLKVNNVKNGASPAWLQNRLLASGLRPISFLVDVSNYILLWVGQPLHIFDADKLVSADLGPAYVKGGTKFLGLDNNSYVLAEGEVVIAEKEGQPHALAGIIGDEATAVSAVTQNIVMEAAIFDPVTIQKSSSRHVLKTDSSRCFARGLDSNLPEQALALAFNLVQKNARGEVAGFSRLASALETKKEIRVAAEFLSARLGKDLSAQEVAKILTPFGFFAQIKKDTLVVSVPSHRLDINFDYDLVEEVGRVLGYNNLPSWPLTGTLLVGEDSKIFALKKFLSSQLLTYGFSEYLTYSFNSEKVAAVWENLHEFKSKGYFNLVNPMNPEQAQLRQTVTQTLASQVLKFQHYYTELAAFEIGKCWNLTQNSEFKTYNSEEWHLGLVLQRGKIESEEAAQALVGLIHTVIGQFGLVEISSQGNILINNQKVGWVKNVGGAVGEFLKARRGTALAEINLEPLIDLKVNVKFKNLGELPTVERDLSLVGSDTSLAEVYKRFMEELPYLNNYQLLDRYHSANGEVVMTWRLTFQTDEKTLTADEVEKIIDGLIEKMSKLGWQKK